MELTASVRSCVNQGMKLLRWVGGVLGLVLALFVVLLLSYYLPASEKVVITGTEVKRMDDQAGGTRDVRYIVTRTQSGDTLVFRNEDTRWGWPPYFKFDSGDIMGEAINLQGPQEGAVVLVTYYGMRLAMLDQYPNVISMRLVAPEHQVWPVFNIVFFPLLLMATVFAALKFRRFRKWWRARRQKNSPSVDK